MSANTLSKTMKRLHRRLTGTTVIDDLSRYKSILAEIRSRQSILATKSDSQLVEISNDLRKRAGGTDPDEMLVEAFALVDAAARRTIRLEPFDVQIIGAIALHEGKIAEMQTGEGKTLSAVFPSYLNALTGQGVHVLTFNDYLARRDAAWMGPIYSFLGLSVGYVREGMTTPERQRNYRCDIAYLTAKEAGFDFLRDSLCYQEADLVHRPFNFALIDEADSILIDEARVPLVIAGSSEEQIPDTYRIAEMARALHEGDDFQFDEYARNIHLTDSGISRVEKVLNCENLYDEKNFELLTKLNCAIHAEFLLHRDVDYIVRDGKIELVDEFTGRVADRRRWPDGLQAALEAKENIAIQTRGQILNSISLQHLLQLYPGICGMTATAQTSAEELHRFYNLEVVVIPPNRPCIRVDEPNAIFATREQKTHSLITEIAATHATGRPILVGTASVDESTKLAEALNKAGIECEVLNARRDAHEAEIIAQAGRLGAVTISTNMAGRGTDIRLGGTDEQQKQQVIELGGLYVIGTNIHESARIDQQLRGRAGRQGDPGSSRFFLSLEDDLFTTYNLKDLLPKYLTKYNETGEIDNPTVRCEIGRLQRIVEGQNLETKKTLVQYAALLEEQRRILFSRREEILTKGAIDFFESTAPKLLSRHRKQLNPDKLHQLCRRTLLYAIDTNWAQYLAGIAETREGIHLHRLGGHEPLLEFQKLTINAFENLGQRIEDDALRFFEDLDDSEQSIRAPSATWTYLVNDNPFDHLTGMLTLSNNIIASTMAPLMMVNLLVNRFRKKKPQI